MKDKELKASIKDLIRGSGRSYPPLEEPEKQLSRETAAIALEKQQHVSGPEMIRNGILQKESVGVM